MDYQTFEPSDNLKPLVKCYWTLDGPKEDNAQKQTIVPDGCMEMIFHYGDLYQQYLPDGEVIIQPRCFVFGQLSRPLEIQPTGITGIFSARFNPDGFAPISPIPLTDLQDKATSLLDLFGNEGEELAQNIVGSATTEERRNLMEAFLFKRFQDSKAINSLVKSTLKTILESRGSLSVSEVSKNQQINRRSIERRMITHTGLSPKKLSKIIRLQSTLKLLISGKYTSLTAVAHEADYYDQSHFIKDFKDITGITPKEFYGDNLKMSSIFYGES